MTSKIPFFLLLACLVSSALGNHLYRGAGHADEDDILDEIFGQFTNDAHGGSRKSRGNGGFERFFKALYDIFEDIENDNYDDDDDDFEQLFHLGSGQDWLPHPLSQDHRFSGNGISVHFGPGPVNLPHPGQLPPNSGSPQPDQPGNGVPFSFGPGPVNLPHPSQLPPNNGSPQPGQPGNGVPFPFGPGPVNLPYPSQLPPNNGSPQPDQPGNGVPFPFGPGPVNLPHPSQLPPNNGSPQSEQSGNGSPFQFGPGPADLPQPNQLPPNSESPQPDQSSPSDASSQAVHPGAFQVPNIPGVHFGHGPVILPHPIAFQPFNGPEQVTPQAVEESKPDDFQKSQAPKESEAKAAEPVAVAEAVSDQVAQSEAEVAVNSEIQSS